MTAVQVPTPLRADLLDHLADYFEHRADEMEAEGCLTYAAQLRQMAALRRGWAAGMRAEGAT